ncbi:MAG TPA: PPOX class F420-dependent oxidoreductase [Solirubrobacteraceae bacterium]|nr:PPOX class F420-dependent oxidoreductase [Solirubrobacteraceae bacterium]
MSTAPLLTTLEATKTVALTTHRRDGTPVTTPVNVVVDDGHAYFRTWETSGKAKRLRHDSHVEVAPATYSGRRRTGPEVGARARLLGDDEEVKAGHALRRAFPFLHGVLVPLTHRIKRVRTVHYELLEPVSVEATAPRSTQPRESTT